MLNRRFLIPMVALLAAAPVFGQVAKFRANIPFEFRIGNEVLPAGQYDLRIDPADHRLMVSQIGGETVVVTWALNTQRPSTPAYSSVVFDKYGDTYFLRQVWDGSAAHGHQLTQSKAERQMAKASGPREVASVRGTK